MTRLSLAALTIALVAFNPQVSAEGGKREGKHGGHGNAMSGPPHGATPRQGGHAQSPGRGPGAAYQPGPRPTNGPAHGPRNRPGYNAGSPGHGPGQPPAYAPGPGFKPGYRPGHGAAPTYANHGGYDGGYKGQGRPPYRARRAHYGKPHYAQPYYPQPHYAQRHYAYRPVPYGGYRYPGYRYPAYGYRYPAYGYPAYGYPYYPRHDNNNDNDDNAAYLIGGLVAGSLLTRAYDNSQANAYYPQQASSGAQFATAPQGRHLLRDLNGACYERTSDGAGNELRTELPPSACNW